MAALRDTVFVCVDCESTGLDPKADRIVEIAVAVFTLDAVLTQFETLVDPECPIPQVSQDIHNISPEMVLGKPKIAEVLPRVLDMVGSHPLVGHGIPFDIELIASESRRHHVPSHIDKLPFFDTLRLARLYGESPINSLQSLRQHFNIPPQGAHRAMGDVLVNIEVFAHLVRRYSSLEAVREALSKPILLKKMPLGKHKGRPFSEVPLEYLRWAEKQDFDQDLLFSIRSELSGRKKGKGFSQASSPFSTLL